MDPKLMYFSPRESTERQRIADMVKPNEKVLVMFSGVGPFAIAIAKKQPTAEVVCVEINKKAVDFANENIELNRTWNIRNYCADAHDSAKLGTFNRIVMPLPETAYRFLPAAFKASKKGAVIHLYGISRQEGALDLIEKVNSAAKHYNTKIRILGINRVLPYAPRTWKMRIDVRVL
jgi:tRNA (guanine37-N1)-methyltransferase